MCRRAERAAETGFAWFEMLLALAMIGMACSVAFPASRRAIERSRTQATLDAFRGLQATLRHHAAEHGRYPSAVRLVQSPSAGAPSPAHVTAPAAVLSEIAGGRLDAFLPFDVQAPFPGRWPPEPAHGYTVMATAAWDPTLRIIMTDKVVRLAVGARLTQEVRE